MFFIPRMETAWSLGLGVAQWYKAMESENRKQSCQDNTTTNRLGLAKRARDIGVNIYCQASINHSIQLFSLNRLCFPPARDAKDGTCIHCYHILLRHGPRSKNAFFFCRCLDLFLCGHVWYVI